jgi:hypothetical protein
VVQQVGVLIVAVAPGWIMLAVTKLHKCAGVGLLTSHTVEVSLHEISHFTSTIQSLTERKLDCTTARHNLRNCSTL